MPRLAAAILVVCFSASTLAAQAQSDSTAYTTAAVILRQEPSNHARSVARLAAETRVRMAGCVKGWCEVGVNGLSGYLPRLTLSVTPKRPR